MAKKILIVDDDKDALTILEARLNKEGYKVIKATNGPDAISLAKIEQPSLAILDIIMPDMGGEELANALKSDPDTAYIPVMFLTCLYTKKEESKQGHAVGGNIVFAKPYNPEELLKEIHTLAITK